MLETDAPDIPPHWLYRSAAARAQGLAQGRNTPDQVPRIAQVVAGLRALELEPLRSAVWRNTLQALPKIAALV